MTKNGIPDSALKRTFYNCTTKCKSNRYGVRQAGLLSILNCGCWESSNFIPCMYAHNSMNDEEEYLKNVLHVN